MERLRRSMSLSTLCPHSHVVISLASLAWMSVRFGRSEPGRTRFLVPVPIALYNARAPPQIACSGHHQKARSCSPEPHDRLSHSDLDRHLRVCTHRHCEEALEVGCLALHIATDFVDHTFRENARKRGTFVHNIHFRPRTLP